MQSNRDLVRVADSNCTENALTFSTGVHYNALHLSPNEEYELFRRKNHVAESYRGPVYVAEDVQVPCAECGCPVDPITRVPVSDSTSHRVYFHPECIKCAICKCNDLTLNYFMVYDVHRNREPTVACARCVYNGYVSLDEPLRRNKLGVSNNTKRQHYHNYNSYNSKMMYNKTGRHTNKGKYTNLYCSQSNTVNKNSINLPCLPGCTPASLSIKGSMHTPHNTTPRAIALIHRQQYYTQNDCNLLMHPPISEEDNERVNEDERRRNTTNYNDQQDRNECSNTRNPPHTNLRLKESNEPSAARLRNERSMSNSERVHKRRSTLPKIEQQSE